MPRHRHLVIFARAPQRGAVKRRLAREIGAGPAHEFYARTSRDLVRRLGRDRRWRLILAVTPDRLAKGARFWGRGRTRIAQGPGDLGRRLGRVIRKIAPGPVVIIGSDAPGVAPAHVDSAFKALAAHEAVFGPAADGGYWLIGLARKRIPDPSLAVQLFKGVRWSTEHALDDTRANLPPGAEAPPLATLEDIDHAASWRRFVSKA
ncbi:MAG: TIGR04282 family arsenosugar biosynthesis glycosyltransferase [Alphaproteobacteria bacterium]